MTNYTQRQWDRTVGWGKVPKQYSHVSNTKTDGQDSKRSDKDREEVLGTTEEEWSLNDPRWDERWHTH